MSKLGVYFGPQEINIVETKNKKPVNDFNLPLSVISIGKSAEEKVPEDVKIVSLLKEGLARNKVEAKEAEIVLSGKDLIIRTFEMPVMLQDELIAAANFEIKKYIPFKIEELICDFQFKLDKSARKNYVLFVGIKKDTLERYLGILNKTGLKANSVGYSGFSILRLLKLSRVVIRGIVAVVALDVSQNDEINFVVLENGFPLFSRDITYIKGFQEGVTDSTLEAKEAKPNVSFDRLKREILISLDYYDRKFPGKNATKVFFITNPANKADLEVFKDSSLGIQLVDISKYLGQSQVISLSFIKAYSGSLSEISSIITANLLTAKERASKKIGADKGKEVFFRRYKEHIKLAIMGLLVCVMVFIFGQYRISPLKTELKNIVSSRSSAQDLDLEELNALNSRNKNKVSTLDRLTKEQPYLTELLDIVPRLVPNGIWLSNFSFKSERLENKRELVLEGIAYVSDSNKEIKVVNTFLSNLKGSLVFVKYLNDISLTSLDHRQTGGLTVTTFLITCRNYKK